MKKEVNFYLIDTQYLKKLQELDSRVSSKDDRAFIGVEIEIAHKKYCIPLTSTIIPNSGKKRSSLTTINIKNEDETEVIACLLLNNMIPVDSSVISYLDFNLLEETKKKYHEKEYRYIKKHFYSIEKKARNVYEKRIDKKMSFLNSTCCDYRLLEKNVENILKSMGK